MHLGTHLGQIVPSIDPSACVMAQCGVPTDTATLMACSEAGYVGALTCNDPACAPYRAQVPGCTPKSPVPMPSVTPAVLPSMPATANVVAPVPAVTVPTLVNKMPSIVNPQPAMQVADTCSTFAEWVDENPVLALLGLAAVGMLILGVKK